MQSELYIVGSMNKWNLISLSLMGICSFASCQGFNNQIIQEKANIDNRYASYDLIINEESIKENMPDSFYDDFYRKQVKEIIINNLVVEKNNSAEKKGYLSVLIRDTSIKENRYLYLAAVTVLPMLLGLPTHSMECTVTLDFAVMNLEGRIIQTFSVIGIKEIVNGAYYGFRDIFGGNADADTPFAKTAVFSALKRALTDARIQLSSRAVKLK